MTLKKRLLILGIAPLILSIAMIGFILYEISSIQSSASDDVQVLLLTESLQGDLVVTKQSLANYSISPTDANKEEATNMLAETANGIEELKPYLNVSEHIAIMDQVEEKYATLQKEASAALEAENSADAKRQSIRVSGILNDMHLLKLQTNQWYEEFMEATQTKVQFTVTTTIIGAVLVILLSIGLSLVLSNRIVKPINVMVTNAGRIADGDLTVELSTKKNEKSKYEIDQLEESFRKMITNLRSTVQSIETVGTNVSNFTTEVKEQMANLTESSNQVAVSTDELATGTQSISEDIQTTSEVLSQIGEEITDNLEGSKQSAAASQNALQAVETGRSSLLNQKNFAQQLSSSSQEIKGSVEQFAQYAGEIENAAQSVRDIAEQTNLLALNAAIEAARAGELGKGFAVVAQEVRKLAEDSSNATDLITSMVKNIKFGIQSIMDASTKGYSISNQQVESMNDTEHAFEEISNRVLSVYNQLCTLEENMMTSSQKTNNVISSIENISAVTEETAAGTEEISASTEEQQRAFEQMNEQIEQLTALTQEMHNELKKFTL